MSWKADKFQPLRDRNRSRAISFSPQVAELQARKARIDSVTAALRDPERPAHDDFMDAFRWFDTQLDKSERVASAVAKPTPTRAEVMAKIARVDQLMRTQAREAVAIAEITRELRGEPEPDPYARSMRFSYGFDHGIKRDQSVVAICGV